MRSLSKSFGILIIVMCMFGYITCVNAVDKLSSVESDSVSAVVKLLGGSTLAGDDATKITNLMNKYSLYYTYKEIDDTLYSNYKNDTSNTQYGDAIGNTITDPKSAAELNNENSGWFKLESTEITYSNLTKDKGYIVALMAVSKTDDTKMYRYKTVYQATTDSTLSPYSEVANNGAQSDEENTNENESNNEDENAEENENTEETEEKADTNPETGISDYAIYIVPLALIAGSTLMIRRNA